METIMPPNFMGGAAKIIAEVRNSICLDDVDAEVLENILQESLNEHYRMLDEYYAEEYYNALNTARNSAYDDGFDDGYDVGYDVGYDEGSSAV